MLWDARITIAAYLLHFHWKASWFEESIKQGELAGPFFPFLPWWRKRDGGGIVSISLAKQQIWRDYPSSAKPLFPCLRTLQLFYLPNLEGWGRRDVAAEQAPSYPYLEDLQLGNTTVELRLHLISVSSSLKSLSIRRINDPISLPEGLQHVSTLQTLRISGCFSLATLPDWIGSLTSLSYLSIQYCPELRSLPEEMRSLRHLYTLEIGGCPCLYERCQMETGEDWPKISHIPEIIISRHWSRYVKLALSL